jgi:hypothetical protein
MIFRAHFTQSPFSGWNKKMAGIGSDNFGP